MKLFLQAGGVAALAMGVFISGAWLVILFFQQLLRIAGERTVILGFLFLAAWWVVYVFMRSLRKDSTEK
jgi:hypothetical protein